MKECIGNVVLNLDYYAGADLYSDGAVEDEILEIVKEYEKNDFPKIIKEKNSWPILYHLSNIRENILSWYPFEKNSSVLEIGAGCGAITGILTKSLRRVVANDLSKKRSMINAYRNKKEENLEIFVGNFNEVAENLHETFDYITLIGVFEYAESYMSDANPHENFLEKINSLLKDDGHMLIAIENRLGLKYFAGCKEDHLGIVGEGIQGYITTSGVRTFCRNEWIQLLEKNGYYEYEFYYPYPDYKLPDRIFSEMIQPLKGELTNNLRNFDCDRMVIFDESQAFDSLIEAGMFREFSNSFFIDIKKKGNANAKGTVC